MQGKRMLGVLLIVIPITFWIGGGTYHGVYRHGWQDTLITLAAIAAVTATIASAFIGACLLGNRGD